jgi:creatinine amidohydrolase
MPEQMAASVKEILEVTESAAAKYLYSDLTWPEVNEAVRLKKVVLLPVGSTEQHGPHLPLDVDNLIATRLCLEAGRRDPEKIVVAPNLPYGYNIHGLDYPGTIHVGHKAYIDFCYSICASFAYHGFKRIIVVNGHGSNTHLLDQASRRTILETDAIVTSFMWWNLLRVDPNFIASFRESVFPGGAGHAGEVETSMYLHLAGDKAQMDKATDYIAWYNRPGASTYTWGDAFGNGPASIMSWTSTFAENGTFGQATLATADKGRRIFEEAVKRLNELVDEFRNRPSPPRVDHHAAPPSCPLPEI